MTLHYIYCNERMGDAQHYLELWLYGFMYGITTKIAAMARIKPHSKGYYVAKCANISLRDLLNDKKYLLSTFLYSVI